MGFNIASATYDDLISTGNISLFSNDEKKAIFDYFRMLEYIEEIIDLNEADRRNERIESLRYLEKENDTLNFYKSIKFKRDQAQIVQGLKHRLNEMDKEIEMLMFLNQTKEIYLNISSRADSILSKI